MKVVIDCRELHSSSGRYVKKLLNYLQQLDKENDYFILLKSGEFNSWNSDNSRFTKVLCDVKEFTFSEQFKLKKIIEKLNPDLVHFTFAQQPVWYKGRVVTTIHDLTTLRFNNPDKNILVYKFKQKVYSWLVKLVAKESQRIITPSQFVKEDLVKFAGIDESKVNVTYEAADRISDDPKPISSLDGAQFIMYIGRPTPHKNLDRLIESFALLKNTHKDLVLVLAGKEDSNYRRIKKKVEKLGHKDIVFTGYISEAELRWLYENCKAYVFPSLSEGFGLPGLEAMVHGAPVVSSNATCLPEVYGDAAEYFDPLNIETMTNAVNRVLINTKRKNQLVELGYRQAQKYSWDKMAEQTLAIYKKALEDG